MSIIGTQYNPDKAMRSQAYAFECWYNIKYEGNTIGVSKEQLEVFDDKWESWYSEWTRDVNTDHNEYEITDEDWDAAELEGEEEAKEESGHDGTTWKDVSVTTGDSTLSIASGAVAGGAIATGVAANTAAAAANAAVSSATSALAMTFSSPLAEGATTVIIKNAAQKVGEAQAKQALAKTVCYIGCAISLAVGTLYECLRPNKDSYEALMKLNEMLKQANKDLDFDRAQLDAKSVEVTQEATNAEDAQASKQKELEEKAMLLFAATMFREEIRARIEAGEQITPDELAKYEETGVLLGKLQGEVEALKADLGVSKEEIVANIEAKQEEYNAIAERIANTVGMTDFIAQFDETTRNLCITEATMQSLNVVSGAISGAQALATGPWGWAFAAMAFAGVGMSTHGVIEQSKFAIDLKGVIDLRKDTQGDIEATTSSYYSALDKYAVDIAVAGGVDLDIENESTAISEELANETPTIETPSESTNPFGSEKPKAQEKNIFI